ncbi:hypothetical protein AURDEDRAFT_115954 [Auricularia subglabra TFB-10046 SS5]|uniref:Uncharacterized protein n=1 Tax=Auricularia subglabra (strain TFB-10046 / SS5) TaxID=717982 RepID=J0WWF7_AURST|nr:hypothetical protein AURDEDRAFT_115954 [Auricularia subglabra TFB-10046 SS5]
MVLVPILVPVLSKSDASKSLILLLSSVGHAKECTLALSEALEHLADALDRANSNSDSEDDEATTKTHIQHASILLKCLGLATPRVALRKQTFTVMLTPWVDLMDKVVISTSNSQLASRPAANQLLEFAVDLVAALLARSQELPLADDDKRATKERLLRSLTESVTSLYPCLRPSLAIRLYEAQNPRLILRSGAEPGWEADDAVMSKAAGLLDDVPPPQGLSGSLALLAHSSNREITLSTLNAYQDTLEMHIEHNSCTDACFAFLLRFLSSPHTPSELDEHTSATFVRLLAPLSAAHRHPPMRLLLFRGLLAPLLQRTRLPLRLALIGDLIENPTFPQLRAAAVGLARAEVVRAPSVQAMRVFGPRVLRPFDASAVKDVKDFVESPEPAWLTEALLFYFAVLSADTENKAGLRDKDSLRSVERDLLKPLRDKLPEWIVELQDADSGHGHGHGHAVMALAGLETALERVDEVRARLDA